MPGGHTDGIRGEWPAPFRAPFRAPSAGLTVWPYNCTDGPVKTTIDLPDDLLHRAKVVAAQRRTTLKELVQAGLDWVLRSDTATSSHQGALERLRRGLRLGDRPLTREQAHERR